MGLAVLLRTRADAEAVGSRLTVTSMSDMIARLFQMSGVTAVLTDGR